MEKVTQNKSNKLFLLFLIISILSILASCFAGVNYVNIKTVFDVQEKAKENINELKKSENLMEEKLDNLIEIYSVTDISASEKAINSDEKIEEIKEIRKEIENNLTNIYKIISENESLAKELNYSDKINYDSIAKVLEKWKKEIITFKGSIEEYNKKLEKLRNSSSNEYEITNTEFSIECCVDYMKNMNALCKKSIYKYSDADKDNIDELTNKYDNIYNKNLSTINTTIILLFVSAFVGLISFILTVVFFVLRNKHKCNTV